MLDSWMKDEMKLYSLWQPSGIWEAHYSAKGGWYPGYSKDHTDWFNDKCCMHNWLPSSRSVCKFTTEWSQKVANYSTQGGVLPSQQSCYHNSDSTFSCAEPSTGKELIWQTHQLILSATRVWLLTFIAAISRLSTVLWTFYIQHYAYLATNTQYKRMILNW
jgi:hypothetical protein